MWLISDKAKRKWSLRAEIGDLGNLFLLQQIKVYLISQKALITVRHRWTHCGFLHWFCHSSLLCSNAVTCLASFHVLLVWCQFLLLLLFVLCFAHVWCVVVKLRPFWEYLSLSQLTLGTEIYLDQAVWRNVCSSPVAAWTWATYSGLIINPYYIKSLCSWLHLEQISQHTKLPTLWPVGLGLLCVCPP